MTQVSELLIETLGTAPADLVEYYSQSPKDHYPESRVNLLSLEVAAEESRILNQIPEASTLGLWVLDDANDSNPFCYVTKGPCAGMILHHTHDPEPKFKFTSLEKFLLAIRYVGETQRDIDELEFEAGIFVPLKEELERICEDDSDESVFLIGIYLPVCRVMERKTKELLVNNEDFSVRECFARWILGQPSVDDLKYAEMLATDRHPQVSEQGKAARSAVNRKKWLG